MNRDRESFSGGASIIEDALLPGLTMRNCFLRSMMLTHLASKCADLLVRIDAG